MSVIEFIEEDASMAKVTREQKFAETASGIVAHHFTSFIISDV